MVHARFKTFYMLLLCCGIAIYTHAQPNTLVMGKIKNVGLVDVIDLVVNEKHLNDEINKYASNVLEDGRFAFAVEINEPQLVTLIYARNKSLVYLEPNDTLYINTDATAFQYAFEFSGRSGHNNTLLHQYLQENPKEMYELNKIQYRQQNYWYSTGPKMELLMMQHGPEAFKHKMAMRKEKAANLLNFYKQNHPRKLTPDFIAFLDADIYYDWAYHLLLYGNVFKNKYGIQVEFFDFLNDLTLQNSQLGNFAYREFLLALHDYYNMVSPNIDNPYIAQYDQAKKTLSERPLAFLHSELIYRAFKNDLFEELLPQYQEYWTTTLFPNYDEKLVSAYQQAIKYAVNTPAPPFELMNQGSEPVSLAQFKGNIVYLNFWASWCRPCIKKMNALKTIQKELRDQNVVFINVSLDNNEQTWTKTIADNQFGGIHLRTPEGTKSQIAQAYEVKMLPQYYLIDKDGRFAEKPADKDLASLRNNILKLIN